MAGTGLIEALAARLEQPVRAMRALGGGCVGDVYCLDLDDGSTLVAKIGDMNAGLDIEGRMLQHLGRVGGLAVPEVHISEPDLLVMSHLDGSGRQTTAAERQVAEAIAALHRIQGGYFGHSENTLIGGLHQSNPKTDSWVTFYRDHRLFFMADEALSAKRLPAAARHRLDRFALKLPDLISEPPHPQLLHGDLWGGNILYGLRGLSGFIDPAIYYGHGEMDLAFSTLFHSLGTEFFQRYNEINPIPPGFYEERRDIYNLYPLLVHIRLFGGSYIADFERILAKFGC